MVIEKTGSPASPAEQISHMVTERKLAEEVVHLNELRLRMAVDAARLGTWHVDLVTNEIFWDDQVKALFGFSPDTIITPELVLAHTHPDDRHLIAEALLAAGNGSEIDDIEHRIIWADGSIHWVHAVGRTFFDESGKAVAIHGISLCIDGHKQAQAELQQQKDLLTTVTTNTKAHLAYMDRDFNFIWVNASYAKADGRAQEEFVGCNHFELYPNAENQMIFERVRDIGIPYEIIEKPFVYPEHPEWGTTYWDWTLTPIKDANGAVQSVVLSLLDVTHDVLARQEIAKARAEAEEKTAQLESFISSLADGVTLFDAKGDAVMMNDAGKAILEVPPDESYNDWSRYQCFTLDGVQIPVKDTVSFRALRGETARNMRYRVITPWGKELTVSVSVAPVKDSKGNVIGATNVFRDVSKQVEFEQEQKELLYREQHIAKMLQQALVPPNVPQEINGYRFAVTYRPALREAEIGGDFYDVFDLGDGRVCVLIGDVAGKGLQAAMRVAAARYAIRSYAFIETRPSRILTLANRSLCCSSDEEHDMLTAFLAIIDTRVGAVIFANAGHEPPLVLHSDGRIEELSTTGAPLGILPGIIYTEGTCRLDPGSRIVIVTDGITEARTPKVELFGKQGVIDFISGSSNSPIQDVVDGLLKAATAHTGGELQDDAAIVIVEQC